MKFYAVVEWRKLIPGCRKFSAVLMDENEFGDDIKVIQKAPNWSTARRLAEKYQKNFETETKNNP
ncbi:MAG: hypothetical protein CV087_07490 [Candidatus Brocadia sp. WS118]|nr:MAG: hypothetical protein CV087_07490 [Candidatus Brocadia sp. WS118]